MAMIFDTLKLSKTLRGGDFSERQADALASALSDQAQDVLATKSDLVHLEMTILAKIADLRADLKSEMSLLRADTIKWIVAAIAFNIAANAGLFKLFAR